jgi:gliding motility-associated-like protein
VVNPTVTSTYNVIVTDFNGCQNTDDVIVFVNALPIADAGSPQIICNGQSANLTAYGGVSYAWSNGGNSQSVNVSPNFNTTFIVTVTDINGCSSTDNVLISVNLLPTANAGNNQSICLGSNATLSATGGVSYSWNNGAGNSQSVVVSPQNQTTYLVTVTDQNGCTSTDNVVVYINQLPIANAGNNATICFGNTTQLYATGGSSFAWDNGGNSAAITVNPNTTSTFIVTVTDFNGCQNTDDVTVYVNALPIADAGSPQIICNGQTANLTAYGGVSYAWSIGLNSQSVNVNPTINTTYIVTVTDINGCSSTDNVLVNVNQLPLANAGNNQSICLGSNATLSATGGIYYSWNNNAGNAQSVVVSPQFQTNYIVTVTDQNGCTSSDNVVVYINQLPLANAGIDQSMCYGSGTSLAASGGINYQWNNGSFNSVVNINPTSTTTYFVTVTDQNGCSAIDDVTITVNSLPIANTSPNQTICAGTTTNISANGGINYLWSNGLGNGQQVTINPTITATYIVTVTDANGCTASDNITINVNPLPLANAGPDQTICNGFTANINASGGIIYQWSNGFITSNITVNPTTTTTYIVNITNNNGCTANDEVTVNVNPTPVIISGPSNPTICLGNQIYLSVNGAYSYTWSPPTGLSAITGSSVTANPTGDMTYTIIGTDINGCIGTTSVNVVVNPLPVANFSSNDFSACQFFPIDFTDHSSTDVVSYLWNFGDHTVGSNNSSIEQNPSHLFENAGTFVISLVVTNNFGCTSTFTNPNMITIHPKPTANFNMTSNVVTLENPIVYFFDNSVNANTWSWDFGDPSTGSQNFSNTQTTLHEFSTSGTYNVWLYVETNFGCRDSIMKEITKDHDFTFYIPNAFTPNGDYNDGFIPKGTGYDQSKFEMIIFDRWGEIIYETKDISKPWNGCKQGHSDISQIGVYVYQIYAFEMDGEKHSYVGTVTIAR